MIRNYAIYVPTVISHSNAGKRELGKAIFANTRISPRTLHIRVAAIRVCSGINPNSEGKGLWKLRAEDFWNESWGEEGKTDRCYAPEHSDLIEGSGDWGSTADISGEYDALPYW